MKQLTTLLIVTVVGVLTASAAAAASLGKQLVELESHIKWRAVDDEWKNVRDDWVRTAAGCGDAACVAASGAEIVTGVPVSDVLEALETPGST